MQGDLLHALAFHVPAHVRRRARGCRLGSGFCPCGPTGGPHPTIKLVMILCATSEETNNLKLLHPFTLVNQLLVPLCKSRITSGTHSFLENSNRGHLGELSDLVLGKKRTVRQSNVNFNHFSGSSGSRTKDY